METWEISMKKSSPSLIQNVLAKLNVRSSLTTKLCLTPNVSKKSSAVKKVRLIMDQPKSLASQDVSKTLSKLTDLGTLQESLHLKSLSYLMLSL